MSKTTTTPTGDATASATQYAIATQRNMYQPDYSGEGHVSWIMDEDNGGYWQDPLTFSTVADAQAYIDDAYEEVYVTSHNEAGRPDWWIVPLDAIESVQACHQDNGNYNWPDDCATWDCADSKGNVCSECSDCIEWMADQDEAMLRAAKVLA